MSLLQEVAFERLLARYERAFGGPPPFRSATLDEVVAYMRQRLRTIESTGPSSKTRHGPGGGFPGCGISPPESTGQPLH